MKNSEPVSRKPHCCDGIYWIGNNYDRVHMPPHTCEQIKKGDKYIRQDGIGLDGPYSFKCCLPCWEYAKKHKINLNDE